MTRQETALEIRSIPKIWPGSTIAILGGGFSLTMLDLSLVWKFRTIGVNHSFRLGPVDVLWFGDYDWYLKNKEDVDQFAGFKCTCNTQMPEMGWPAIKRVRRNASRFGLETERADYVCWNNNSGGSAINLAYHLGAKRVLLLGFDMRRATRGRTHFHNYYGKRPKDRDPYPRHLLCFDKIAEDANKVGLEIINCTPQSAITQFPFIKLEDIC